MSCKGQFTLDPAGLDPTSHADFAAATHPGMGGGTHRRRAAFERREVFVGGVRLEVWGAVLVVCVCVSVSGVLFSVGVCVRDLLICLPRRRQNSMMWSPLPQRYSFGDEAGASSLCPIDETEVEARAPFLPTLGSWREPAAPPRA